MTDASAQPDFPLAAVTFVGQLVCERKITPAQADMLTRAIFHWRNEDGSVLDRRPCKRPSVDLSRRAKIPAGHDGARLS